jgi:Tol biopolymer transport system component
MKYLSAVTLVALAVVYATTAYGGAKRTVSAMAAASVPAKSQQHVIIQGCEASPDGRVLALCLGEEGGGPWGIRIVRLGDGSARRLAWIPKASDPAWSPDGKTLAYCQEGQTTLTLNITNEELGLYSLLTGHVSVLPGKFVDRQPDWDRSGTRLAFTRLDFPSDPTKGATGQAAIIGVAGGGFGKLTTAARNYACVDNPSWSPSGSSLALIGGQFSLPPHTFLRQEDVYLAEVTSGKTTKLTNTGQVMRYSLSWSPDGKYLAFADGFAHFKSIQVVNVTSHQRRVILRAKDLRRRQSSGVSNIQWSPDGKRIVFAASRYDPGSGASYVGSVEWPSAKWRWLTNDGKSAAPRWLSVGANILYVRNGKSIWRVRPDGTGAKMLYALD